VFAASERDSGLAALTSEPLALGELATEPHLAGAEVLAASGGRLLVGRAHGGQRDLGVLECKLNPSPPPAVTEGAK
jgi:hypothetical protein